jgi:hypothetical protein
MRFMTISNATAPTEHTDLLDATHEPTDAQLAVVMADVSRVVKEKRNMAYVRLHETVSEEARSAQVRMDYLRTQFKKVPRL